MSDLKIPGNNAGSQQQEQDTNLIKSLTELCEILNGQLQMPFVTILAPIIRLSMDSIIDQPRRTPPESVSATGAYRIFCQYSNPSLTLKESAGGRLSDCLKSGELKIIEDIKADDPTQYLIENYPKHSGGEFPEFNLPYRFLLMLPFSSYGVAWETGRKENFKDHGGFKVSDNEQFLLCLMDIKPRRLSGEQIGFIRKITNIISSTCNLQAKSRGLCEQLRQLRHDLRTPLTSMTMIPQMLKTEANVTTEFLQMLDQILTAARKMTVLLDATYTSDEI